MIGVGDRVVAVKDPGLDELGQPWSRPTKGKIYVITGIYQARYGLGCTLKGLDPSPFRGYLLHVRKPWRRDMEAGWYFRKVEPADEEFTAWIKKIKVKENTNA